MLGCTGRSCESSHDERQFRRAPAAAPGDEVALKVELKDLEARLFQTLTSGLEQLRVSIESKVSQTDFRLQIEEFTTQEDRLATNLREQHLALVDIAEKLATNNRPQANQQVLVQVNSRDDDAALKQVGEQQEKLLQALEKATQLKGDFEQRSQASANRVNDLESKVKMLSDKVESDSQKYAEVEEKVMRLDQDHASADIAAVKSPDPKQDLHVASDAEPLGDEQTNAGMPEASRELSTSVWEAALLIGMPNVPHVASVMVLLDLLLNSVAQMLFCIIVASQFLDATLPDTESLESWRVFAHDVSQTDPITGSSLVGRICGEDNSLQVAQSQSDILGYFDVYSGRLPAPLNFLGTGRSLTVLSWLMWFMCAFNEGSEAISFFLSIYELPRGQSCLEITTEGCRLSSLNLGHFILGVVLTVARLIICVYLGKTGSEWLLNQLDVEDLVLNAAALVCVLDFDEIMFQSFMPPVIQTIVSTLEPLSFSRRSTPLSHYFLDQIGVRPLICLATGLASLFLFVNNKIDDNIKNLEIMETILCGGNTDFAISFQVTSGLLLAHHTPPYDPDAYNAKLERLKRGTTQLKDTTDLNKKDTAALGNYTAFMTANMAIFKQFDESSMEDHAFNIGYGAPTCDSTKNDVFGSDFPGYVVGALKFLLRNESITGCKDMLQYCSLAIASFVRVFCPSQCGCDNPLSGLFYGGPKRGCPRAKCMLSHRYVMALDSTKCEDPTAEELGRTPGWRRYWTEFADAESAKNGGYFYAAVPGMDIMDSAAFASFAQYTGCDIFLYAPKLVFTFCYQTDKMSSVASFCPEACGCRITPDLPACPTTCTNYKGRYDLALDSLPCKDLPVGAFKTDSTIVRYWQVQHYFLYKRDPRSSGTAFQLSLQFHQFHSIINTSGCDPGLRIGNHSLTEYCQSQWGGFDVQPLCPEMCQCRDSAGYGCPTSCIG